MRISTIILATLGIAAAAIAQTTPPETHIFYLDDNGLWNYNSATGQTTKVSSRNAMGAMISPDGRQIVYGNFGYTMSIMNNDGTNERQIPGITINLDFANCLAWTTNGMFWVTAKQGPSQNQYRFFRYVPETNSLTEYPSMNADNGFAGCWASTDGSRMFSWTDVNHPSEILSGEGSSSGDSRPYIYFDNGDFSAPRIRYIAYWGHGNAMLPNGKYLLCVRWDFGNGDPLQGKDHPWLATWDLDSIKQGPKWAFPAFGAKNIVSVVNSNDWIGVQMDSDRSMHLWKYASDAGWTNGPTVANSRLQFVWQGALPSPTGWSVTEPSITLTDSIKTGAIHVTGWSASANPTVTVQTGHTWTGTPTITKSGTTVTISFTITPPASPDTATITIADASSATRLSRIVYQPSQTPAQKLVITTTVSDTAVALSWTGTTAGYTYGVKEATGSTWSALVAATTSYMDKSPVSGTNQYRVYAIKGTDTSFVQVTASWSPPPSITITAPTSGLTFASGSTVNLRWTTVNVIQVNVQMSTDGGETYTKLNSAGINTSSAQWGNFPVPMPAQPNTPVLLKVESYATPSLYASVTVSTGTSAVIGPRTPSVVRATGELREFDLRGRSVAGANKACATRLSVVVTRNAKGRTGMELK